MFILYRPLHPKTNIISLWKLTDGRLVSFWSSICRGLELVSMSPNVPEARLVTEVATVYSSLHPWVWLTMPIHWHRASKMKVQMSDVMMVYTPWGLQVEKILNTPENETYKLICIFDMCMITNQSVKVKVVRWCLFPSPKTKERRCGSLPISQR